MEKCDSAITTTPLTPWGLKQWKTEFIIVALLFTTASCILV
jgi:hypothetical protein